MAKTTTRSAPRLPQPGSVRAAPWWAATAKRLWYGFLLFWVSVFVVGLLSGQWLLGLKVVSTVAVLIAAGLYGIWRHIHLKALAREGFGKPNVFRLHYDIVVAQKRRAQVQARWSTLCENQPKLRGKVGGRDAWATLTRLDLTADGNVTAQVDMSRIGKTVGDLFGAQEAIEGVTKATHVIVREQGPGTAKLVFQFTDPLHTTLLFRQLALPQKVKVGTPPRWVGGVDETGAALDVSTDKPVAVGGETGSGKSVFSWGLVGSLIHQGLWVVLLVVDPKGGAEFGRLGKHVGEWIGRLKVESFYAGDNVKEGRKVIHHAYNLIDIRAKKMGVDGARKLAAGQSQDDPLYVLLIDEALDYAEDWKKSDSELVRYARKCRSVGGTLIAVFQFGHASELGVGQKVFGARFCFRAAKETGDTILGTGSYERGARVNEVPRNQPGIGYYADDEGHMLRFRAPHVTDDVADLLAVGALPEGMNRGEQDQTRARDCAVYELPGYPSAEYPNGRVLYIGKALQPWDYEDAAGAWSQGRLSQHAADKPWWGEVDQARIRVHWCESEAAALELERKMIKTKRPIYNDQHNRDNPDRIDWRAQTHRAQPPAEYVGARPSPAAGYRVRKKIEPLPTDLDGEAVDDSGWKQPAAPAAYAGRR